MVRGVMLGVVMLLAGPVVAEDHVEMAARINVAETLCDINFGKSLVHHVILAASERGITLEQAARLADRRHAEIVAWLNRARRLDEFCDNARAGRL